MYNLIHMRSMKKEKRKSLQGRTKQNVITIVKRKLWVLGIKIEVRDKKQFLKPKIYLKTVLVSRISGIFKTTKKSIENDFITDRKEKKNFYYLIF